MVTKQQLDRGARVTEILKQGQYNPIPQSKQVSIIYAAATGMLDKVPVANLNKFEEKLFTKMEAEGAQVLANIEKTSELSDDDEVKLKAIIEDLVSLEVKVDDENKETKEDK